jgi:hypothetical protein
MWMIWFFVGLALVCAMLAYAMRYEHPPKGPKRWRDRTDDYLQQTQPPDPRTDDQQ